MRSIGYSSEKGMLMVQAMAIPAPHQPLELRSFAEPQRFAGQ
jgi:hypothetical protein